MATVESDICNRALLRVGQKQTISNLETDTTTPGALCRVLYAQCRDEVLEGFPWPFAAKHQVLALLPTTRSGWAYMYELPEDCLFPRYIYAGVRPGGAAPVTSSAIIAATLGRLPALQKVPFTVELSDDGAGRVLLTDQSAAELIYTAEVADVTAFPPLFVSALAWRLASELALALPVKAALADWANKQYLAELARAGATAFRGAQEDPQQDATYIASRG